MTMLQRRDVIDILVRDEECMVVTDKLCLRVSPIPTAIVEYLVEPRLGSDLMNHLESILGPPAPGRFEEILTGDVLTIS